MWFAAMDAHRVWGPNDFSGSHSPDSIDPPFYLANGDNTKADLAKYYDEIFRLDHYIGLVYTELVRQGVANNTVIIIMADNGRPFPHSKTRVNDRGMKTPFVIHWPSGLGTKSKECSSLISSIDIAPTILELASAEIPAVIQGRSFVKLLNNPDSKFRKYIFAEHNWHDYEAHERMVRTKEFLYILNSRPQFPQIGPADAVGSPSFAELDSIRITGSISKEQADVFEAPRASVELYDCESDTDQFVNIAGVTASRSVVRKMRNILDKWMTVTGDNIPESITKDWYERVPGYVKTAEINKRGEPVDKKYNATLINNKGPF
jgi:hypothetical protein